jgi:hypothetical protein
MAHIWDAAEGKRVRKAFDTLAEANARRTAVLGRHGQLFPGAEAEALALADDYLAREGFLDRPVTPVRSSRAPDCAR